MFSIFSFLIAIVWLSISFSAKRIITFGCGLPTYTLNIVNHRLQLLIITILM